MSFPSSFRLRDYKLLAKRADKSGWATDVQEKSAMSPKLYGKLVDDQDSIDKNC